MTDVRQSRRDFMGLTAAGIAGVLTRPWIGDAHAASPVPVSQVPQSRDADLVVFNARVYTVDSAMPRAQAFATSGGRIITIGVGNQVRPEFLRAIASRPEDFHFCNESVELQGTFINLATELGGN